MSGGVEPRIVAGVSGSKSSVRALRWAANEARLRHQQLRIVLAWERAQLAAYSPLASLADTQPRQRTARKALSVALTSAFGHVVPHGVTADVIEGRAERVLVQESAGAGLLVLGSASQLAAAGFAIGPVIRGCLNRARCPVVIIGPQAEVGDSATSTDTVHADCPRDEFANVDQAVVWARALSVSSPVLRSLPP
jgi:nucleotide-binding universal stress UspA family protein